MSEAITSDRMDHTYTRPLMSHVMMRGLPALLANWQNLMGSSCGGVNKGVHGGGVRVHAEGGTGGERAKNSVGPLRGLREQDTIDLMC